MVASFAAVTLSLFAVTQTARPASIEVFTTSSSSSALQADHRDAIRAFLADRVRDAFGVDIGYTPEIDARGPSYAIGLHFEGTDRVLVEVSRDGELLASRPIAAKSDDAETGADVWMLVRSSIERDALEHSEAHPAPIASSTTAAEKELEAMHTREPEPEPDRARLPDRTPLTVENARPLRTAPFGVDALNSISATLMTEAATLGTFGFGPAASASVELDGNIVLGASLAYRSASFDNLNITRMPFALRVGYRYAPSTDYDLETGFTLSFDGGIAAATTRTIPVLAITTGPYLRGRLPVTEWEGADLSLVAELGGALSLLRSSYFVNNTEYTDGLFSARMLAGVEWRWR